MNSPERDLYGIFSNDSTVIRNVFLRVLDTCEIATILAIQGLLFRLVGQRMFSGRCLAANDTAADIRYTPFLLLLPRKEFCNNERDSLRRSCGLGLDF